MLKPSIRWFRITPGLIIAASLVTEGSLYLAEWFRWLPKGWPVLIAIAAISAVILLMLVWFAVALVFHWWFQFSLRSLLVLISGRCHSGQLVCMGDETSTDATGGIVRD